MPVARDGEQPLRVVAADADRWRGPCLRSPPIPRVRGQDHVLSPTTGRRTPMKHWTDLFKLVVALLTLAVLLPAPAALAGSSADEIKNCPDQNWCAYHRTDRKSTRLNSSHGYISYAVFCLKKKKN